ncbi:MAG TPA: CrcB family protein, partial [Gaiellales bacterium]|nr:CrcB family protein [Gaiellales bacterium]
MPTAIAVAIAGSLGAVARYAIDYYAGDQLLPHHQVYVTFAINVIGSFLLGMLVGIHPADKTRIILGVGFLGAFTTFSTLMAQVYHAVGDGRALHGVLLPTVSVAF